MKKLTKVKERKKKKLKIFGFVFLFCLSRNFLSVSLFSLDTTLKMHFRTFETHFLFIHELFISLFIYMHYSVVYLWQHNERSAECLTFSPQLLPAVL